MITGIGAIFRSLEGPHGRPEGPEVLGRGRKPPVPGLPNPPSPEGATVQTKLGLALAFAPSGLGGLRSYFRGLTPPAKFFCPFGATEKPGNHATVSKSMPELVIL